MVSTGDPSYARAVRPRITIKTIDGADTLYTYDAFNPTASDIVVTDLNAESSVSESGTFDVNIDDSNNELGRDNIHNVKVFLELSKTSDFTNGFFMICYGDVFRIDRPATRYQQYNISGFGTAIQASRLMIHRREKYRREESDAKMYNIVDNALTKRKWRPLKTHDRSIQDITGWSRDGISTKVNTPFTVVDKAFVYFSDFLNELCSATGAVWFIDYSTGDEVFTLSYNSDLHTGVQIKSGDLKTANDNANTVSYIKRAFSIADDTTTEGGIATRLITTNIIDRAEIFHQSADDGKTSLNNRAIAQQVVIDNDARRVESIEINLDKTGEPASPNDRINGDIVLDKANKPTGEILDEFHIDIGSVEKTSKNIEIDLDIKPDKLDVSSAKFWVRLFQRSGDGTTNSGEPQNDPDNTINWFHNNKFATTQPYYSATAPKGDSNTKDKLVWTATNQGPLYTVNVRSNIRRAMSRTNGSAVNKIGLREVFVDTSFLDEPQDISRFLSLILAGSSKARRSLPELAVTIPNDFTFRPYQWISFNDGLSQTFQDLQVQRVRYSMDSPLGSLSCNITLSGLYNTLIGNCQCL